jgi:hypothetical protein
MLVLAGTNDIARGVPLSTIENNLTMIADLADHYKIKPLFASVLPISDYHKDVNPRYEMTKQRPPATILELNRWLDAFCKQRHYPYVDYFSQMVDQAGYMKADLADDGLHPNSVGYRVMGPIAMDAIEHNLGRPVPPPPAAITSSSKKRVTKVRAPQPADTAKAPAESTPAPVAAVTSASKKRATKAQTPKPVEPPETAQAPAESATPSPAPAARKRPTPVAAAPAPAPARPAPVAATPAAPAPTPRATADAKPAEKTDDAAKQKKKKESFWRRTYPSNPPPQ